MFTKIVTLTLLLAFGVCAQLTRGQLQKDAQLSRITREETPVYLPDIKFTKLLAIGFDHFLADIIWFETMNYFGEQLKGARDFRWLGHRCELVTQLNPKASQIYEFCGPVLSWMARDAEASNRVLELGSSALPTNWKIRYLRAFNFWYFLERRDLAREELLKASTLAGAPPILASLAARLLVEDEDPQVAVQLLSGALSNTKDPDVRERITDRLNRAVLAADLKALNQGRALFRERFQREPLSLDELVEAKIVQKLNPDPFGGTYLIDPNSGEIRSTSGEEALTFRGKTAKELKPN